MRSGVIALAAFAMLSSGGNAQPLTIVEVSAPAINCVFNPACKITVSDTVGNILPPTVLHQGDCRLAPLVFGGISPLTPAQRVRAVDDDDALRHPPQKESRQVR